MELEVMKTLWNNQHIAEEERFQIRNLGTLTQSKYRKSANSFIIASVIGLFIAYSLAGLVIWRFSTLDHWSLIVSNIMLATYLLVMPLYTIVGMYRMKDIDLAQSNYKEVLLHFLVFTNWLKRAESISFWASPFLFVAAVVVLSKAVLSIDLFTYGLQAPAVLVGLFSFTFAIFFNIWAFKKRKKHMQSLQELLEEGL